MQNIIFVPGNGGCTTQDNWFLFMQKHLEKHGYQVTAAQFPDPELAREQYWIPFLRDTLQADKNSILIGHSSGAIAAMRFAQQYEVGGIVLVGAYHTDLGMDTEKASGYFDTPWDWQAIKKNAGWISLFASQDDPWIPIQEPRYIHQKLNCEYHEFTNQGHFGGDYFKEEFPELVTCILQNIQLGKNNMNPTKKSIGIVGGAGPMASSVLLEYLITEFQQTYNCKDDADFPLITLISVPFAQMLHPGKADNQESTVTAQLHETITQLQKTSDLIGIACNTLHAFCKTKQYPQLIDLISITDTEISNKQLRTPLVLGTSTSAKHNLHAFTGRIYPNSKNQEKLDWIIDQILAGKITQSLAIDFISIVKEEKKSHPAIDSFVLGCTEFSVLAAKTKLPLTTAVCIDPLKLLTHTLCKLSVETKE